MIVKQTFFEVKKEHLMLLRKACVDWDDCEFGAPCINPKRPYGNSGVVADMIRIFGKEVKRGITKVDIDGEEFYITYNEDSEDMDELERILVKLHKETETVLQIILSTGTFAVGVYKLKSEYGCEWEKVE